MLELAINHNGPSAIRYPRGKALLPDDTTQVREAFQMGKSEVLKDGSDIALLALGHMVHPALKAAERLEREGISAMVINARFVKPLDHTLLSSVASEVSVLMTIEENVLQGGFGSAVLEFLNKQGLKDTTIRRMGIPDTFLEQGSQEELRRMYGLDEEGIYTTALSLIQIHQNRI
jgi:1-deoxy-D-xylulose-5-phosphate synthase